MGGGAGQRRLEGTTGDGSGWGEIGVRKAGEKGQGLS